MDDFKPRVVKLKDKTDYPFYDKDAKEGVSVCTAILDLPEEERAKYCDPSQLDKNGKYRYPKVSAEMIKAKLQEQKDAPDMIKKQEKQIEILNNTVQTMVKRDEVIVDHAKQLEEENKKLRTELENYKALTEERLNNLASLVKQLMP